MKADGPPPPFVDRTSFSTTTVLDGGKSEVTQLQLGKPGTYVLFCPLSDRDGGEGKSHDEQGLLTKVQVR